MAIAHDLQTSHLQQIGLILSVVMSLVYSLGHAHGEAKTSRRLYKATGSRILIDDSIEDNSGIPRLFIWMSGLFWSVIVFYFKLIVLPI